MKRINDHTLQNEETLLIGAIKHCIHHWPSFLIFLTILGISSLVFLKCSPVYYQANALLIIKDEKKGSEESKLMESLNLISTKKIIENEVQVLQSRAIIDKLVQKLYLNAPIYVSKSLNKSRAYLISPIFIEVKSPDKIDKEIGPIKFD